MRTIVLATTIMVGLVSSAHAEGNGGPLTGSDHWQTIMGNPTIPATEWFAMTRAQRRTRVRQLQLAADRALWSDNSCGQIIKVAECPCTDSEFMTSSLN